MVIANVVNQPVELRPHALGAKVTQELDDIMAAVECQEPKPEKRSFWAYQAPMPGVRFYGFYEEQEPQGAAA